MQTENASPAPRGPGDVRRFLALTLGSIGIVYGDIGTSPLYAFREALKPIARDALERSEIISLTSLIIWSLTLIVTVKYVLLLLRADNGGEGGTLSLLALLMKKHAPRGRLLMILGLIGAALFLGDAMITPALSVLSAVEGLKLVYPATEGYIVPIALAILTGLFIVQSHGTGAIARFFGPITALWFLAMALGGVLHISDDFEILAAFNPVHAVTFLLAEGWLGVIVLGAVFLTVTGAEALYADLGHFGRRPIQFAWCVLVFPALTLNYLGQGAMVLKHPQAISDPFFLMFPQWSLLAIVVLATIATVIASQAVITGAFSLVSQAIHLGFLPRLTTRFTSETHTGQIFLPAVNSYLLIGVMGLVLTFGSSEKLATAYGISVTGAMVVTSIMFFQLLRTAWKWPRSLALLVLSPFLALELVFLGANMFKIHDGGYIPVLFATGFTLLMLSWRRGTGILLAKTRRTDVPLESFVAALEHKGEHAPTEAPGTAIFLTADPEFTPAALLHNLKHNHVIHARNVILTIRTLNTPYLGAEPRSAVEKISERFSRMELRFGYMETQNVSQALGQMRKEGLKFDIMSTSFYLGRRKLMPDPKSAMPRWQNRLFILLANNAADPSDYFRLPANRVVEMGSHVFV